MKDFDYSANATPSFAHYLTQIGEIGFVEEVVHSIINVSGIPGAKPNEVVLFENGSMGQVFSIFPDKVDILLLSQKNVAVGTKVVRTGMLLQIPLTDLYLGRIINPLGQALDGGKLIEATDRSAPVDTQPHGIIGRRPVTEQLETGVAIADMVVPIGKGQRELIIGDRKTGKTEFVMQTILSQAARGGITIYAVIGQRQIDILKRAEFLKEKNILGKCVLVGTSSNDPSGLIFLTPYSAMSIAEYFRDKGMDVLLILDDLTTHAKFYREISLLAKRFPGKGSYPGDIFYVHAKIIERAGNYQRGSITCLPLAESVMGDLSGYIQTNLMAMTDGHMFFDIDRYNRGVRPAINPFLSVTRVGHQTQGTLLKDASRSISGFLVEYEKMKTFTHFGAEAGDTVRDVLEKGSRLDALFNQSESKLLPVNTSILITAGIWAGVWNEVEISAIKSIFERVTLLYLTDGGYKNDVDMILANHDTFEKLVTTIKRDNAILVGRLNQ
jgi:F-type H+-transporting ATPase subunit alpha